MVGEVFRNLIPNPSLEYGTTDGWAYSFIDFSVSTNEWGVFQGTRSLLVSAREDSPGSATTVWTGMLPGGAPVAVGECAAFAVSARRNSSTPATAALMIRYQDDQGGILITHQSEWFSLTSNSNSLPSSRFTFSAPPAPTGAVSVRVTVRFRDPDGESALTYPKSIYIDGAHLAVAETEADALDQVATYFDGDTPDEPGPDGYGWVYAWDGEPGASSSTKSWGQAQPVAVRVVEDLDAPAVGITVEGLSSTEASRVAIYRQTPGKERTLVQGLGDVDVDGAGYWVDYLPPLGVPVTYVVEVLEGDPLEENSATITIPSSTAWLQDALNPLLAVEVACRPGNRGTIWFTAEAFTAFERPTNSDLVQIMGGRTPVGMTSRRQTPAQIPFNMVTTAAEASSMLREVLIEGTHLVLRVPPEISMLDPVTYLSDVQVSEEPGRQTFLGGHVTRWNMTGSQTRGPRIMAWTALWTYDDVAELYAGYTYTDLTDGRKYVDWLAKPDEAQLAGFSTTSGGVSGA